MFIAKNAMGRLIGARGAVISALRTELVVAIDEDDTQDVVFRDAAYGSSDSDDEAPHRRLSAIVVVGADTDRVTKAVARIQALAGPLYQPRDAARPRLVGYPQCGIFKVIDHDYRIVQRL